MSNGFRLVRVRVRNPCFNASSVAVGLREIGSLPFRVANHSQ